MAVGRPGAGLGRVLHPAEADLSRGRGRVTTLAPPTEGTTARDQERKLSTATHTAAQVCIIPETKVAYNILH